MKGKRVVVVGMGASGVAAARLCLARGAEVVGVDRKELAELGESARAFVAAGGKLAPESERDARVNEAELVVVSPGVPSFPALEAAAARAAVWSEVELAYRELRRDPARVAPKLVAVGGTNGKSTVTTLVGEMLEEAGKRTFTGGNLGEPLSSHVDEPWDAVVLEVSSFQLERVVEFHPDVSILLNVTPDHLDRYPSFDAYAAAKGNAFMKQTDRDLAIIPLHDVRAGGGRSEGLGDIDVCAREARRGRARIVTFGPLGSRADIQVALDAVVDKRFNLSFPRSGIALQGEHNAMNVAAAWAAACELGVSSDVVRRVLRRFKGLAHRMSLVAEIEGVRYYDDSKGTNVGASVTALRGLSERKAVLIAGGVDKGGSYEPLVEALRDRARAVVLIGEAAPLIEEAIRGRIPVRHAISMDAAVRASAELARRGDAVLLSPACSSFDMFRDYKDRGDAFVRAVQNLAQGSAPENGR